MLSSEGLGQAHIIREDNLGRAVPIGFKRESDRLQRRRKLIVRLSWGKKAFPNFAVLVGGCV